LQLKLNFIYLAAILCRNFIRNQLLGGIHFIGISREKGPWFGPKPWRSKLLLE